MTGNLQKKTKEEMSRKVMAVSLIGDGHGKGFRNVADKATTDKVYDYERKDSLGKRR